MSVSERTLDRYAMAHDASHYLLVPEAVLTPRSAEDVAAVFRRARERGESVTFRSGGTSLSGQGVTDGLLVDVRKHFGRITIGPDAQTVALQPGVTVRRANAHLARSGRKLGPDPASEIACTIGGVIANNSSGMACGVTANSYRTVESLRFVLPSGTVVDTGDADADARLGEAEPGIHAGLTELRDRVRGNADSAAQIRRQFAIKNTMGYAVNAFLDFDEPVHILEHLLIGSEGTLAFVAEARFRTIPVQPVAATGLLIFPTLHDATSALPALVASGLATIELMDAQSLRVAKALPDSPEQIRGLEVTEQAALLVEFQEQTAQALASRTADFERLIDSLTLARPARLTEDAAERDALWHVRKGLYTAVAEARPSGTAALLEDIAVPVEELDATCHELIELFERHGYTETVIFGHAKDGNIHFMLNERFDDPASLQRYRAFTEDMVELVLGHYGNLKAEHGTGRIMAPFVRRQYGDELYEVMLAVKRLIDPAGLLNPGVLLTDDQDAYLQHLKTSPAVEQEVDSCVECGYCEPTCPSRSLTTTPRQRIVLRREIARARDAGDSSLADELTQQYQYDAIDTCAVDGLCSIACPVNINTGDLVRRLRAEEDTKIQARVWSAAAGHWGAFTRAASAGLTVAHAVPAVLPVTATKVGRAVLGAETVPLYSAELPRGGERRHPLTATDPEIVYFPACINTMFGPADGGPGVRDAFLALCERAGIRVSVPDDIDQLCCGTPWKSKGHLDGHHRMAQRVIPSLTASTPGGEVPVVVDAASCTEGLHTMISGVSTGAGADPQAASLQVQDATEFVATHVLPRLQRPVTGPSLTVHHTCSTTMLGINPHVTAIANFISDDVTIPVDWGCCAFAGDRGLLHPELTASATAPEAASIAGALAATGSPSDLHVSANRTCELGMTRATGEQYLHILEALELATRG